MSFLIHFLFTGKFTIHAKPLPDPGNSEAFIWTN